MMSRTLTSFQLSFECVDEIDVSDAVPARDIAEGRLIR